MSIPRALFRNTLEEATTEDWEKIVAYIQRHLRSKNLFVSSYDIAQAAVWYLEWGINILIPTRYCLYNLIKKLELCLEKGKTTLLHKQYISAAGYKGTKVAIVTDKRGVGFYDKTAKELANGVAYNRYNKYVFQRLLEQGYQVLRYEVKMENSATVKQTLKSFGIHPTFKAVWDNQINPKFWLIFMNQ